MGRRIRVIVNRVQIGSIFKDLEFPLHVSLRKKNSLQTERDSFLYE